MWETVSPVRKKIIGLSFALLLALTTFTSSAFAHECIVASRSDTGNVSAGTNSKNWFYVGSLKDLFGYVPMLAGIVDPTLQLPPLSADQLDWAVQEGRSLGLPSTYTIFVNIHVGQGEGVLLGGTPVDGSALTSNGKGIDHVFDYLPTLIDIYQQALSH
jgi:hypothetical protein